MKLYSRTDFMKLPAGTVYLKYDVGHLDELCIKGDTFNGDFTVQGLSNTITHSDTRCHLDTVDLLEAGHEVTYDMDYMGRDGCFDDTDQFAVLSAEEVLALITRLGVAYVAQTTA